MTLEQLVAVYQRRYGQIRSTAEERAAALWLRHGGLTDADAELFSLLAARQAQAAMTATASLVAGYLTASRRLAGVDDEVQPLNPGAVAGLRGVDQAEEWHRPAVTARVAIADGHSFEEAMAFGGRRAMVLMSTDVLLAQRAAIAFAGGGDRIVGYRRVLTGKSCALCASASTQRYHRGALAPIHTNCDCSVAEIYGDADPGHVINSQRLADLKARTLDGDPNYWTSRHFVLDADDRIVLPDVSVHQHGELGPVLTTVGHAFTGPADIAA